MTSAVLGLVLFLVWLVSPHDDRKYDYYTVAFADSISVLEAGSDVEYKGVKVGKVMMLRLVPGDSERIDVDIRGQPGHARSRPYQGFAGDARRSPALSASSSLPPTTTRPLPSRPDGEKYPVLRGEGSRLYKALEDLPDITAKILDIARKFDGILDDDTVGALKQTALNVQNMSRDLNGLLAPVNVSNASTLIGNLSASSAQVPEMIDHLKKTADQMDTASASLQGIITRNKGNIDRFASEGLSQISAASREAKGTASSLRGLADKLKDDPSQLFYQPSSRGVEIPK